MRNENLEKRSDMEKKLYADIRFLQGTDEDYNRVEAVFCGLSSHCEANSKPVINYLKDWDDDEVRLVEE